MFNKKSLFSSTLMIIFLGFVVLKVAADDDDDDELSEFIVNFIIGLCVGMCQENPVCNYYLTIITIIATIIVIISWCIFGVEKPRYKRSDLGFIGGYGASRAFCG